MPESLQIAGSATEQTKLSANKTLNLDSEKEKSLGKKIPSFLLA